jgi:hypothetical protein
MEGDSTNSATNWRPNGSPKQPPNWLCSKKWPSPSGNWCVPSAASPSSATYTRTRSRRPCSNRSPNSRNASIAPSSAPSANSRNYRKSAAKRPRRPPKKPRPLLPSRDRQEAVPRLNRGTLWVRPLGPPPPPSDAPDLAYTMSAEPPTPAQPDSVTFRANGGIDT